MPTLLYYIYIYNIAFSLYNIAVLINICRFESTYLLNMLNVGRSNFDMGFAYLTTRLIQNDI